MPTYVYKFVKTGETIEVEQSFAEASLTEAVNPRTGRKMAVKKVFTPVGVTFRGDGFYKTDSRSSAKSKAKAASDSGSSDSSASSTGSGSSESTTSESSSAPKESASSAPAKKSAAKATAKSATSSSN